MDDWLKRAIAWASERVEDIPQSTQVSDHLRNGTYAQKARATLKLAQLHLADPDTHRFAPVQFAHACTNFANEAKAAGLADEERAWLSMSHRVFSSLVGHRTDVARSLNFCEARLADLGVSDPASCDPVIPAAGVEPGPAISASNLTPVANVEPETTIPAIEVIPPPAIPPEQAPQHEFDAPAESDLAEVPDSDEQALAAAELPQADSDDDLYAALDSVSVLEETSQDRELTDLVGTWPRRDDEEDCTDMVQQFVTELKLRVSTAPIVYSMLAPTIDEDAVAVSELLARSGIPKSPQDIRDRARMARALAVHSSKISDEESRRRRWFLTGFLNFALWKVPYGWSTNEPYLIFDIFGYVGSVQVSRRFEDRWRDLILACIELTTQLAYAMPESQATGIRHWLKAAWGWYLLVGGPAPALPSQSRNDQRVHRVERQDWGVELLKNWRGDEVLRRGASFSLAILARWESNILKWMLRHLYADAGGNVDSASIGFWEAESLRIVNGAQPIRIASNPWAPHVRTGGHGDFVLSDSSGEVLMPTPVLRAMAAQVTEEDQAITIQGSLFKGRRVPTYLVLSQYGPFGILKLDFADRVEREHRNYHKYARKRLHSRYRPSECKIGDYKLFVGSGGMPLQAILTSYVFSEDDRPTTLSTWMRSARPTDIAKFIDHLFLKVLRPWVAHISRRFVDLRMEYPILRPRQAEQAAHAPESNATTELKKVTSDEVESAFGTRIGWRKRSLDDVLKSPAKCIEQIRRCVDAGIEVINPLWMISELAELGDGIFDDCIYSGDNPLSTYHTLTTICHGDLHGDNVLCASWGANQVHPVIVDFEKTHDGHICQDFARLEAAILCQVFEWSEQEILDLSQWIGTGLAANLYRPIQTDSSSENLQRASVAVSQLRAVAEGCGQHLWPLSALEYKIALLASLTPVMRSFGLSSNNRALALLLAGQVASSLSRSLLEEKVA